MRFKVNYHRLDGYSLLELIIVMIIIVVLSLLAYSSYQNFIVHARRAEAKSALLSTLLLQERYYTLHNTYLAFDINTTNSPFKWWSGDSGTTGYYELSAELCPNQSLHECVLLSATPGTVNVRHHSDPVCGSLLLDSANHKTNSVDAASNAACW